MTIAFPSVEAWDANRGVVAFPADDNGKRVHCAISWEALQDIVWVKFVGTHAQYDRIDVENVNDY